MRRPSVTMADRSLKKNPLFRTCVSILLTSGLTSMSAAAQERATGAPVRLPGV
jgi:hypothetical protein